MWKVYVIFSTHTSRRWPWKWERFSIPANPLPLFDDDDDDDDDDDGDDDDGNDNNEGDDNGGKVLVMVIVMTMIETTAIGTGINK